MTPDEIRKAAAGILPSARQLAWQELEFTGFLHFGMNTFTDKEWGDGKEDPQQFNPTELDARQWVRAGQDAGMKLMILTAKHHDGFCLWPSRFTEHGVRNSPWKGGKGDVVREFADACHSAGMKMGLYLSPWDRHETKYGDSPAYNEHFKNQLRELLTNYGEVSEVWFDGACAEGPNGRKQEYDWAGFHAVIRECQPDAAIAICGPDARWVGNESGFARDTEWSVVGVDFEGTPRDYNEAFYIPYLYEDPKSQGQKSPGSQEALARSKRLVWWPAETDVSIRPGWFYHASEDLKVKSVETLVDIYYKSIGRNTVLLLNVPPDRRGLIHEVDSARLREFRAAIDRTFKRNLAKGTAARATNEKAPGRKFGAARAVDGKAATFWATEEGVTAASLEVDLGKDVTFNRAMYQEMIALGQKVEAYSLEAWHQGDWK
ncbi:MAG: alpha-L-fucosidase, partial [Planctomycetota bacterium]